MPMTIYKLYASSSGDSVASFDVQLDGEIKALLMSADASGADALNEGVLAELSFLSSNTFANSDVRGSLMTIQIRFGVLTSGGMNASENYHVSGLEVPVNAGERIFLHVSDQGTLTGRNVYAYLYIKDKGTSRRR